MRRDAILSAVRAALAGMPPQPLAASTAVADGAGHAALAARFVHEARAVGTIVHEVASRALAIETLSTILAATAPKPRVVAWATPLALDLATAAVAMGGRGLEFIGKRRGFEAYGIDPNGTATFTPGFRRYTRRA